MNTVIETRAFRIPFGLDRYLALVTISARSNFAYLGEVFGRQLFLAAILYILLRLWKATYSHCGVEQMAEISLPQMLWYLTIAEAIILSSSPISAIVDEEVRNGSLAIQLIRPMSYPIYRLVLYLGERYVRLMANLAMGTIICFVLVGQIPIGAINILALIITLPLALTLDFLGNFLVGLGAFWLENTNGILIIYSKFVMLLGGVFLPLDLLPAPYADIAKSLPFACIVHAPARQFIHPVYQELLYCLILQIIWTMILSLIVWRVYKLALKRIAANGG
jgi:ABC-2 type transport system permease protein